MTRRVFELRCGFSWITEQMQQCIISMGVLNSTEKQMFVCVCCYIRKSCQSFHLVDTTRDGLRISDITLNCMDLRTAREGGPGQTSSDQSLWFSLFQFLWRTPSVTNKSERLKAAAAVNAVSSTNRKIYYIKHSVRHKDWHHPDIIQCCDAPTLTRTECGDTNGWRSVCCHVQS